MRPAAPRPRPSADHSRTAPAFPSRDGDTLLHDRAYYTLNEIPKP